MLVQSLFKNHSFERDNQLTDWLSIIGFVPLLFDLKQQYPLHKTQTHNHTHKHIRHLHIHYIVFDLTSKFLQLTFP